LPKTYPKNKKQGFHTKKIVYYTLLTILKIDQAPNNKKAIIRFFDF